MTTLRLTTLRYAQSGSHRCRWWRWAPAALLVLALGTAWWWGPALLERLTLAGLQRQCLEHVAPDGQVSYADAGLIGSERYRAVPAPWSALADRINADSMAPVATAFVGQRSDPAGRRRLVVVEVFDPRSAGLERVLDCRVRVVETSPFTGPRIIRDEIHLAAGRFPADAKVRIFAGRRDPGDPTHFTIDYQVRGASSHTIDGWLGADARVLLESRAPRDLLTMGHP